MSTTIPGPVVGTRISAEYAGQIARFAYFWAWPMVNMHNRLMSAKAIPAPGLAGGFLPVTPPNRLCMLRDYIVPSMRAIACPNQDVVYGQGFLDLEIEPVVIQIPEFGDRFWVYQAVDQRTDSFVELGAMYATQPGFYLLAHTDWDGPVPDGITEVFRCPTRIGAVLPRLFMDDTVVDWVAIQPIINQINGYPLSEYDGHTKSVDWSRIPIYPVGPDHARDSETSWVDPETFFSTLPAVLDEVPPLPGEHSLYHQIRAMLDAVRCDPDIDDAVTAAAHHSDRQLVAPLFEFSNYGLALPHHWTQVTNGAQFGTDYFTRTAVAKSSMFVNRSGETAYFYQDFDSDAARLTGANRYSLTFLPNQLPPAQGFWSLTVYNEHHFFHPNEQGRYSLGTKTRNLRQNDDGSLTLYIGAQPPRCGDIPNWLPAPDNEFSLLLRAYWPTAEILDGLWTPPAVKNRYAT